MNVLTQRIGPLPAWVWGAGAAVAVWFFLLRGKSAGAAAATGKQAPGDYSLGYAQGLQAANPQGAAPGPAPAPTQQTITIRERTSSGPFAQYDSISPGVPVYLQPGRGQIGTAGFGSVQKLAVTSPGPGMGVLSQGNPSEGPSNGFTSTYWGIQYGPATGWVGANDVSNAGPSAVGGPARKHAGGSRQAAAHWSDAHPLIGAPVRYPHFVRAVGGPGNHQREVHRVAHQAGVHPARIQMLNPRHTGMIRVA